jgi:hypothetical protein
MKILQILGHNAKWNIDSFLEQKIGDGFLITAFTFGNKFKSNKQLIPLLDKCMLDLQFYGKKAKLKAGKLLEFDFHPTNGNSFDVTNVYIQSCIKQAIQFQIDSGFKDIIIPICYESDNCNEILQYIYIINSHVSKIRQEGIKFFMTLPFSFDIIRDQEVVDRILIAATDKKIVFDGYNIVCENKPEQGHKITTDIKLITNLSTVFKTLKYQGFKTIYSYANWDAIIYIAQTDIDYVTIGSYENLRNFSIKRFTEDISGGASKGYYFSEKLLNMIRAQDLIYIQANGMIPAIKNEKNIFSDIILATDYLWNIHKPDVNKNYLLSISRLLCNITQIEDVKQRTLHVLFMIQDALFCYKDLEDHYIALAGSESKNYHLETWKMYLLKTIGMKPDEFITTYNELL